MTDGDQTRTSSMADYAVFVLFKREGLTIACPEAPPMPILPPIHRCDDVARPFTWCTVCPNTL